MAISIQNRRKKPNLPTTHLKKIALTICEGLDCPDAELSVVITDDATIRELNRTWRGKDKETDVLSFSQVEVNAGSNATDGLPPAVAALLESETEATPPLLGDVVISAETAARQACSIGHSYEDEVRRLLVHGVLHLLGHDHVHGGRQAARMKAEETRLLALLKRRVPRL